MCLAQTSLFFAVGHCQRIILSLADISQSSIGQDCLCLFVPDLQAYFLGAELSYANSHRESAYSAYDICFG